ncbi:ricin-type beta-trefoil lectin domain protein [Streptomyces stramineus]
MVRFFALAAATASIGFAAAGPAAADGAVDWQSKVTGECVTAGGEGAAFMGGCGGRWYDEKHPEHGNNWIQYFAADPKLCLDSSDAGRVYLNPCTPASRYNKYQFWSEEKWNGGWVLKNVATGRCLSVYKGHQVRTLPCNSNNRDQFWK